MRVTAVVPQHPRDSRVGAWIATCEMVKGLIDRGHRVDIVPAFSARATVDKIDGAYVHPSSHMGQLVNGANAVLSHLGDNGAAHAMALAVGAPSVRIVHGQPIRVGALRGAAAVVANSKATADLMRRYQGHIEVIHPPIDIDRYRTTPGDSVTLVNLSVAKGGEVFWRLAKEMAGTSFIGVTGGHGRQVAGDLPNVEVLPPQDDMRTVYARTRVILMPSRHEAWGMVSLEAAASGIPTLARPVPGLVEALGDAGTWESTYSIGAWKAALEALLEPEAWKAASARSLARAEAMTPEADRRRFADLIERVAR